MNWATEPMPDAEAWLDGFRRVAARQAELFAEVRGIAGRTNYEGTGAGGDRTLVIDRRAEDLLFEELERFAGDGAAFTAISEERGEVVFGNGDSPVRVVIDPIDGSLNARRTLPSFSFSAAVASGSSMADVEIGFVHDFGTGEEFSAIRGAGAKLDGEPLEARGPGYGLELVGIEGAEPGLIAPVLAALVEKAWRIRAVGSLALTVSYVAAGRLDAMLGARETRSVDVAAAQLIAREAGAELYFGAGGLAGADLGLDARYPIAAGLDAEMLATMVGVLEEVPPAQ